MVDTGFVKKLQSTTKLRILKKEDIYYIIKGGF